MRKIILSVNSNPAYLYYLPLTVWSWLKIGWQPIVYFYDDQPNHQLLSLVNLTSRGSQIIALQKVDGYRSDTITQMSRLYGAIYAEPDDMVMLGDIDMLGLSDYWNPSKENITIYGHDLTNYTELPICYVCMTREKWVETICITSQDIEGHIKRDLDKMPDAKSSDFYKYWSCDQKLLTERVNAVNFNKVFVDRGRHSNGMAIDRVDRGVWSLDHANPKDAHLHRDLYKAFQSPTHQHFELYQKKWREHMDLLHRVWPEENWDWLIDYTKKFAELV